MFIWWDVRSLMAESLKQSWCLYHETLKLFSYDWELGNRADLMCMSWGFVLVWLSPWKQSWWLNHEACVLVWLSLETELVIKSWGVCFWCAWVFGNNADLMFMSWRFLLVWLNPWKQSWWLNHEAFVSGVPESLETMLIWCSCPGAFFSYGWILENRADD